MNYNYHKEILNLKGLNYTWGHGGKVGLIVPHLSITNSYTEAAESLNFACEQSLAKLFLPKKYIIFQ